MTDQYNKLVEDARKPDIKDTTNNISVPDVRYNIMGDVMHKCECGQSCAHLCRFNIACGCGACGIHDCPIKHNQPKQICTSRDCELLKMNTSLLKIDGLNYNPCNICGAETE